MQSSPKQLSHYLNIYPGLLVAVADLTKLRVSLKLTLRTMSFLPLFIDIEFLEVFDFMECLLNLKVQKLLEIFIS